jgi:hypothetical protein
MKFSLILNTRKRTKFLVGLFNSLFENTAELNDIEILVRADKDDEETLQFYHDKIKHINYDNIMFIVGKERPTNLHTTLNFLAKHSIGEYIFVLNDDTEIKTKDWDKIAYDKLDEARRKNRDRILYGRTNDNSVDKPPGGEYASFPIISKEGFNTLGFIMHEDFVGLGGDSAIYRVYNSVDRVVDLNDVWIDHVLHNEISKIMVPDETAYEMRLNTGNNYVDPLKLDVSKDIEKLKQKIETERINNHGF